MPTQSAIQKVEFYQNFPVDATASNVPFTSSSDNISAFCKAPLRKKITLFQHRNEVLRNESLDMNKQKKTEPPMETEHIKKMCEASQKQELETQISNIRSVLVPHRFETQISKKPNSQVHYMN